MQPIDKLLSNPVVRKTSKPTETISPDSNRKSLIAGCWQVLLSRKLVSDPVGSDSYKVFERDMADVPQAGIAQGLQRSRDFVGFFTFPAFRDMCRMDEIPDHPMYRKLPKEVFVPASEEKVRESLSKIKSLLG